MLRALVIALMLATATIGCSRVTQNALGTLKRIVVGTPDVSNRAAETPYASIRFSRDDSGALLVLAEQAGSTTFWQSTSRQTVVLNGGYPDHTSGLGAELLATRVRPESDATRRQLWRQSLTAVTTYTVARSWRDATGDVHAGRAEAKLQCASESRSRTLPLTTIVLRKCWQHLAWKGHDATQSTLWIAPDSGRIWAYRGQPWPGSGTFAYQVARPWW